MTSAQPRRGEIWWVDFGEPAGSAPAHRRPALVIADDRFNRSRISTTVVAAITSNLNLAKAPGNVTIPDGLLPKASVVNVSQLATLDRDVLESRVAAVPAAAMREVDAGLRLVLSL